MAKVSWALLASHMIVYWFSQDSNITPPVCVAAYAGAAIAGSDPWKTGWTSFTGFAVEDGAVMISLAFPWLLVLLPLPFLAARWLPTWSTGQASIRVPRLQRLDPG